MTPSLANTVDTFWTRPKVFLAHWLFAQSVAHRVHATHLRCGKEPLLQFSCQHASVFLVPERQDGGWTEIFEMDLHSVYSVRSGCGFMYLGHSVTQLDRVFQREKDGCEQYGFVGDLLRRRLRSTVACSRCAWETIRRMQLDPWLRTENVEELAFYE